jgi:hypothetical protein
MSREFNNGVTTDLMTFPIPASIPVMNDALVLFAYIRVMQTSDNTWLSVMELERSGGGTPAAYLGFAATGGSTREMRYINTNGSAAGGGLAVTDADNWCKIAVIRTSAAGTTYYKRPAGGSTSTAAGGALADGLAWNSGGVMKVGGDDDPAFIRVACVAYLNNANVTTGDIDAWDSTQDVIDAGFTAVYDDSDSFASDLVGSADRTAINGTTDNADDPAGWTYFGGGGEVWPPVDTPAAPPLRVARSSLRLA